MSWVDKLLEWGSTPDWISPTIGIIKDVQHGGGDTICFHRSVSVNEAKRRLVKAGIEHWADFVDGDYGYITVPHGFGEIAGKVIDGTLK